MLWPLCCISGRSEKLGLHLVHNSTRSLKPWHKFDKKTPKLTPYIASKVGPRTAGMYGANTYITWIISLSKKPYYAFSQMMLVLIHMYWSVQAQDLIFTSHSVQHGPKIKSIAGNDLNSIIFEIQSHSWKFIAWLDWS
jgi:hypothetical protein